MKAEALYNDAYARKYRDRDETLQQEATYQDFIAWLQQVCGRFTDPIDVLDLGCGTGRYFWGVSQARSLVGLDASPAMLVEDGFHEQGKPMMLPEFRALFSGPLMGNCGYTQEAAEAAISSGQADLIAFGRPYLSNPDLVERFTHGGELNPPADMKAWSAPTAEGYTDFPFHPRS